MTSMTTDSQAAASGAGVETSEPEFFVQKLVWLADGYKDDSEQARLLRWAVEQIIAKDTAVESAETWANACVAARQRIEGLEAERDGARESFTYFHEQWLKAEHDLLACRERLSTGDVMLSDYQNRAESAEAALAELNSAVEGDLPRIIDDLYNAVATEHRCTCNVDEINCSFCNQWSIARAKSKSLITAAESRLAAVEGERGAIRLATIEECAKVAEAVSGMYPRKEIGWDNGYAHGATRSATEIRHLKEKS